MKTPLRWLVGSLGLLSIAPVTFAAPRAGLEGAAEVHESAPHPPLAALASEQAPWERLPLYTGDVNDLIEMSDGTLLAATFTGIFRSTDGGTTWASANVGMPTATAITLARDANDRLYASVFTRGVFVSTDAGATWTPRGPEGRVITSLAVGPTGILHAATSDGSVLRSTDGALTWQDVPIPFPTAVMTVVSPAPGIVLAGTLGRGVLRSVDGGLTWGTTAFTSGFVRMLRALPDGRVFAGMEAGPGVGGSLHVSGDLGATWTALSAPCAGSSIGLAMRAGDLVVGCAQGGVFRSADDGQTWVDLAPTRAWVHGLHDLLLTSGGDVLLATIAHGVHRSRDGGSTWTPSNEGLTGYRVTAFVTNAKGHLFASTSASGLYRSTDRGASWHPVTAGLTTYLFNALAWDPRDGSLWVGADNGRVHRSLDDGATWSNVSAGLLGTDPVNALLVDERSGARWAGRRGRGVWILPPGASTWQDASCGLGDPTIHSLAQDDGSEPVAGGSLLGAFRLRDNQACWSAMGLGLPGDVGPMRSMARDHTTRSLFATTFHGVFRVAAGDSIWEPTALDIPWVNALLADRRGAVFAGLGYFNVDRDNDVLRSTDGGATWVSIRGTLPTLEPITALGGLGEDLVAGTWHGGVFVSRAQTSLAVEESAMPEASMDFVRPNPFRDHAEIAWRLAAPARVSLKVYGIDGRAVRTLREDDLPAGTHVTRWDGRDDEGRRLASGLYLCRLEAGGVRTTRKLVLAR